MKLVQVAWIKTHILISFSLNVKNKFEKESGEWVMLKASDRGAVVRL